MKRPVETLHWPLRCLPLLLNQSAGTFPMMAPGCNRSYEHVTFALHLHDYPGDWWIGKRRYRLEPGDITLSPANETTRYFLPESGSHLCIHFFPEEKTGKQIQLPFHLRLGAQTAAARERFWRAIDHMRQAGREVDSPAHAAASAALQELLLWLGLHAHRGASPRRDSLAEEALAKLNKTIEASLAKPMLIGELAAGVGLSADYVARLFARRYGMTLQHYLLQRRIEVARHLLVSSDLLVSEIGRQVGLPDPQYFNKQFRRVAGQSPLAYRRQKAHRTKKQKALEFLSEDSEKRRGRHGS
jgi:AraC-like DNA-binding protein